MGFQKKSSQNDWARDIAQEDEPQTSEWHVLIKSMQTHIAVAEGSLVPGSLIPNMIVIQTHSLIPFNHLVLTCKHRQTT